MESFEVDALLRRCPKTPPRVLLPQLPELRAQAREFAVKLGAMHLLGPGPVCTHGAIARAEFPPQT
jgi:hypothetical protein